MPKQFIIGDLHGMYDMLMRALDFVKFDYVNDELYSVGDLIDRGPDNMKCLALLRESWFFPVMGNHEEMMATGDAYWEQNGGWWIREEPNWKEFLPLVKEMPYLRTCTMKNGKLFHVVHAELPMAFGKLIDKSVMNHGARMVDYFTSGERCVTWGRNVFLEMYGKDPAVMVPKYKKNKMFDSRVQLYKNISPVYCGHTVIRAPLACGNLINLDTGACFSLRGDDWAGLTLTEPATGRFWTTFAKETKEVSLYKL